jgi:3-hydroxypropanoate dehydrogenase
MPHAVNDEALDRIFRAARTHNAWTDKPVSPAVLMALYDMMRWGPTAVNSTPARIVFAVSQEAKTRLKPHLAPPNVEKTMSAPVTAILGYDLDFATTLPKLFPHYPGAKDWFADPAVAEETAFRNASLQGGYFIVAARSLGLDCGPMSGFDIAGVTKEFFAGTKVRANFLCNLGYGDPKGLHPRGPRLSFDEACRIV